MAMKVAISVPERVFEEAEMVAKRLRVSRSRVYAQALEEFVKKHRGKGIREALNAVYGRESSDLDPVLTELQAEALREEW
jgi:metal-responsive CopG/Arc/MetJ family transcriptional regulator